MTYLLIQPILTRPNSAHLSPLQEGIHEFTAKGFLLLASGSVPQVKYTCQLHQESLYRFSGFPRKKRKRETLLAASQTFSFSTPTYQNLAADNGKYKSSFQEKKKTNFVQLLSE